MRLLPPIYLRVIYRGDFYVKLGYKGPFNNVVNALLGITLPFYAIQRQLLTILIKHSPS